ncbi:hypothetical protein COS31_00740 [Candidatus Roizmanbacteria bacterium CG02_land_8_20_14_3_00_36_15]|uniref:Prephenate/arogenate dehydrogenase domain-containing protein n=3 Tax=Candidatus Roizmaniibacteriota TaxID=1752723 RepID=A0A2M8EXZ0_9BACT|nr:MAG: hypothetical protein COV86_04375 [Candidatus Roizmanbacteria bacterium CG11_big_fil_rev_8_21_14_0_20_35_14]PIV09080.1 MAG: hypothetical protein COS51_04955 [Candidatus Roizmanbacteria bacterium CG03_land_8_20_14_0_80_36_21]PIV38188.1 MAG: hypothetical protein COS31_00740 [Candidatus Roizmanbacteria bacterium CG02_land_8_20_14_3_00_36_15]PIY70228.1 MAG: hypothetical protein COY89_02295 [Candidatus Roizmanbacteria bacterium CG_4_10_14_0_8_um_filter_36_36]PJA52955.1 MAG: hypothetical prote
MMENMKKIEFIGKSQHIAIIGYGRFGNLLEKIISLVNPEIPIKIYSLSENPDNIKFFPLEKVVKNAGLIIPAVPINKFESACQAVAPYIQLGATVVEVCSVMEHPVKVMKDVFKNKPDVNLVASHPMFGPAAWKRGGENLSALQRLKIVINNVRCPKEKYQQIITFLRQLGLNIFELEPEEHDKLMANSQFFVQLVRQIAADLGLDKTAVDTPAAAKIFEGIELMGSSRELFLDMITFNRFAKELLLQINYTLNELVKSLN